MARDNEGANQGANHGERLWAHARWRRNDRAAGAQLLADLEHVLRIPGAAVRFCAAERPGQPYLPDPGRQRRCDPLAVDRRAAHGPAGAADHRLPPPVFSGRCTAGLRGPDCDAAFRRPVDRCGTAVDPRCLDQCVDGAVPCLRRRPAGSGAATHGLFDAEFLHRRRFGGGERPALGADAHGREQPCHHRIGPGRGS